MTVKNFPRNLFLSVNKSSNNLKQPRPVLADNPGQVWRGSLDLQTAAHTLWMMRYSAAKANTKSIVAAATDASERANTP
jgi:hypothetical protein